MTLWLITVTLVCSIFLYHLDLSEAVCNVPPYSVSLHEVNVTAESETLLLTEGKCYLGCLKTGGLHQVLQIDGMFEWDY
jgi:hypothetical protein